MEIIDHIEVGSSGQAEIDFTVPQTYQHLFIQLTSRCNNANRQDIFAQFNSVQTSTYSMKRLYGTGSTVTSDAVSNTSTGFRVGRSMSTSDTANTFASNGIYFPNYSISGIPKSASVDVVEENNGSSSLQMIFSSWWSGTDPITSIKLTNLIGSFVEGTSATLYGIRSFNTESSPLATGGIISYSDGYWYHTFTSSGTFTPSQSLTVDSLVVAGGGGGGSSFSAGGGAGGMIATTGQSVTAQAYTVTVGAGGATDANGGSSSFNSVSTTGGGSGGGGNADSGGNGGSGGGGAGDSTNTPYPSVRSNYGTGISGQGNNGGGGNRTAVGDYGGGGGGKSAAGNPMQTTLGSNSGGAGAQWLDGNYYAGGGGGYNATGGTGGGGNGGPTDSGRLGQVGTGGGGGGTWTGYGSAAGGSGIVIVRYSA